MPSHSLHPHQQRSMAACCLVLLAATSSIISNPSAVDAFSPIARGGVARSQTSSFTSPVSTSWSVVQGRSPLHQAMSDGDHVEDVDADRTTVESTKNKRKKESTTQPTPVLVQAVQDYFPKGTSAAAAAAAAAVVLSTASPLPADAAMSGGRMGGSFAAPRSSGGGGSMRMAPSGGGGFSRGYSSGFRSGGVYSPTIVTPYISPFGGGFYRPAPIVPFYGGGVGSISYSRGPGLFDLLFLGALGWFAVSAVSGALSSGVATDRSNQWSDSVFSSDRTSSALGPGTSVARISVALDIPNRDDPNSLLSRLDRLAASAKTDSRKGVQNLTSQVAVELLRRKSSIQSASSSYKHVRDDNTAQRTFNQWSVRERSKFEQETVSKFGGQDTSSYTAGARNSSADNGKATMAVVTLVLSIQGDSTKIPKIRSIADVEDALRKIAADVKVDDCLTGAEILWTPQDRSEVLSRQDVVADYPELTTV